MSLHQLFSDREPDLPRLYAYPDGHWLRANMVATADGAASLNGVTQGISSDTDRRVFALLRTLCDVILVGASTVREEKYKPGHRAVESPPGGRRRRRSRWSAGGSSPYYAVYDPDSLRLIIAARRRRRSSSPAGQRPTSTTDSPAHHRCPRRTPARSSSPRPAPRTPGGTSSAGTPRSSSRARTPSISGRRWTRWPNVATAGCSPRAARTCWLSWSRLACWTSCA